MEKLKSPMAIRLRESDMVIPECVHSHEIPEKTHLLLHSQACHAKLGMTKRVRDGSITLDDYDAQTLEVARLVGTGLFMMRIDHLRYNDYVCNPLLNDLIIDFDNEPGIDSTPRDSDQSNFPDCFTHAMVNVHGCEIPRNMLQADTIVVSSGRLGESQPRMCWVICDSVPVCVAVDRLRPCTSADLVAFPLHAKPKLLHLLRRTLRYNKASSMIVLHSTGPTAADPSRIANEDTTADPSRTADEGEDEDDRDDEMAKPTQITRTEKRKDFPDGRNSKRVTGTITKS